MNYYRPEKNPRTYGARRCFHEVEIEEEKPRCCGRSWRSNWKGLVFMQGPSSQPISYPGPTGLIYFQHYLYVSGSTKWYVWFTVRWLYPRVGSALYALQQSETIVLPGKIYCSTMGNKVEASGLSTGIRKPSLVVTSMPPNTHCSRTILPRLYFCLVKTLSSISTVIPGKPSWTVLSIKCSSHISRKSCFQSTIVEFGILNSRFAVLTDKCSCVQINKSNNFR